jgi:hypothetical protein
MCPIHHPDRTKQNPREDLKLATSRVRCYLFDERAQESGWEGFCFVADFGDGGVNFYLGSKLAPGSICRIAFEARDEFAFRGVITWSIRYAHQQGFLGSFALQYRGHLKLWFRSEAERRRYFEYREELRQRALSLDSRLKF